MIGSVDVTYADYFIGALILVLAFALGFINGQEQPGSLEKEPGHSNVSLSPEDSEVTHFCIEQGYDDGYYSDYFENINCYQHHSRERFQQWEQGVNQ